jgi:hypothetical protein
LWLRDKELRDSFALPLVVSTRRPVAGVSFKRWKKKKRKKLEECALWRNKFFVK